ncbi:DUF2628 domain-containing protein [Desulfitobacterium sp. THU1]|uniref:DUF2628 domain-containing protein n=1 Tax=Desulfitobacterium sp. THU1 TaxID=3138072 RepID=UPI00311EA871
MSYEHGNGHFKIYDEQELLKREEQELLRLYIGKNADYYLRKWSKKTAPGTALSWNMAAFLFSALWVGYRQMYAYLVMLVGALLSADLIYIFVLKMEPDVRITILISCLMGAFGNALYYRFVQNKILQLKAQDLEFEEMKRRAATAGGPNWRGILATVLLFFLYNIALGYFTSLFAGQVLV